MRIHKIRTHKIILSFDLIAHPTFIDVVVGYITGHSLIFNPGKSKVESRSYGKT